MVPHRQKACTPPAQVTAALCCSAANSLLRSVQELPRTHAVHAQIEETNLFPDKATGSAKGCGFVTFKSQEQAQNAMNALSGALTLQVG